MSMPQDPSPNSSLPRWVIPTAVAGAVLSFVLVVGFTGSLMWVTARAQQALATQAEFGWTDASELPETPDLPTHESPGDAESQLKPPGGDFKPEPDSGGSDDSASSAQVAGELQALADTYLDAKRDGTITSLVPGGDQVDPAYIGGFLYAMTDLKSASRFGGSAADMRELLEKAKQYEERFLAGEDLDVSVRITREDGSVFESDGVYRLVE